MRGGGLGGKAIGLGLSRKGYGSSVGLSGSNRQGSRSVKGLTGTAAFHFAVDGSEDALGVGVIGYEADELLSLFLGKGEVTGIAGSQGLSHNTNLFRGRLCLS